MIRESSNPLNPCRDRALAACDAGFVVIPAMPGKRPLCEVIDGKSTWEHFRDHPPDRDKILQWYSNGRTTVGVATGKASKNLTLFEFDDLEAYEQFRATATRLGGNLLVDRIEDGYLEHTPGGGVHWFYYCEVVKPSTKLATRPKRPDELTQKDLDSIAAAEAAGKRHTPIKTLIETKGDGGYAVIAPSAGLHENGKAYTLKRGGLEHIATITSVEQDWLFGLASTFDEKHEEPEPEQDPPVDPWTVPPEPEPRRNRTLKATSWNESGDGWRVLPGDDYNTRATWGNVLTGWAEVFTRSDGATYWRRPGKSESWSATTNRGGKDRLAVYSSSTEFESVLETRRTYSKFEAYAALNHRGDFKAAAKALHALGYGEPNPPKGESKQEQDQGGDKAESKPYRWEESLVWNVGDWLDQEINLEYDVQDVIVRRQPGVFGGPRKGLKTTASLDLAVSMACGAPFLGRFHVPERRKVLIISGESGDATIHETLRRICEHKRVRPENGWLVPGFKIPMFADPAQALRLSEILADKQIGMAIIDPLYLAAADPNGNLNPADLFAMGQALRLITDACLNAGCTPIINHHYRRGGIDPYEPPELEHLSHAGIVEFARQWVLLGRREKYEPGSGIHRLWLSTGGSAGHGGLWGLDVNEPGRFRERTYSAEVVDVHSVRQQDTVSKADAALKRQQEQDRATEAKTEADAADALSKLREIGGLSTEKEWAKHLTMSRTRFNRAVARLQSQCKIHPATAFVACNTGKREVSGWASSQ